jgi:hypothetical protein
MADDKAPAGNPYEPVFFLLGILAVLFALWWMRGASYSGESNILVAPPVPLEDTQTQ